MSEETTDTDDNQEEASTEAALEGVTSPVENEAVDSKTDETSEDATPQNGDDTVQDSAKPDDNDPEKLRKAFATEAFEKREAKRETLRLKGRLEKLEASKAAPVQTTPIDQVATNAPQDSQTETLPNLPTLEDPDVDFDQGKLNAKMVTYHRNVARITIADERKKDAKQQRQTDAQRETEDFWKRSKELQRKDPAYEKLVEANADIGMTPTVQDEIIDSEMGPELHRHLIDNPDVLTAVNGMTPRDAIREIAKIEISLSDTNLRAQPIKETKAPKVIETVGGGSGKVPTSADAGDMDEYYDRRMVEKKAAGVGLS